MNMSKYAIIGIILGTLVLVAGLIWLAGPTANRTGGQALMQSALKSDGNLFDFGTISMAAGKVSHQFKITNGSDKPVKLSKIFTSCMCTTARLQIGQKNFGPFGMEGMGGNLYLTQTLNPGDSGMLEAIFDPTAHGPAGVGVMDRFIYLNDTDGGQLELEIKSFVTP